MERLTKDEYFLNLARVVSLRSTCSRLDVGAVFVNRQGHIVATGYNGPPSGLPHEFHDHETKDCNAIHAEENAIIQCKEPFNIETVYLTHSPCRACLLKLLNTSATRIVYLEHYRIVTDDIWTKHPITFNNFSKGNFRTIEKFSGRLLNLGVSNEKEKQ